MFGMEAQEYDLQMEMSLTAALRLSDGDEECYNYIVRRWSVLKQEILKKHKATGEDAADIFHRFQKGVHARHEVVEEEEPVQG